VSSRKPHKRTHTAWSSVCLRRAFVHLSDRLARALCDQPSQIRPSVSWEGGAAGPGKMVACSKRQSSRGRVVSVVGAPQPTTVCLTPPRGVRHTVKTQEIAWQAVSGWRRRSGANRRGWQGNPCTTIPACFIHLRNRLWQGSRMAPSKCPNGPHFRRKSNFSSTLICEIFAQTSAFFSRRRIVHFLARRAVHFDASNRTLLRFSNYYNSRTPTHLGDTRVPECSAHPAASNETGPDPKALCMVRRVPL
jgi:hypothetical protein